MKPEARCGARLVVTGFVGACGKEFWGEISILGKDVDTFSKFELDPAIARFVLEIVLLENSSELLARQTRTYS